MLQISAQTWNFWVLEALCSAIIAEAIVGRTVKLLTFTTNYVQVSVVIPFIIVAPYFFLGKITLGQMNSAVGRCPA